MRSQKTSEITSKRICKANARQAKALQLRLEGHNLAQIAAQLGYADRSCAFRAIETGLTKTLVEPAAALRKMELARLDGLFQKLWPKAMRCQFGAIDRILKIMERRAKLLGLDAPAQTQLTGADGGPLQVAAEPVVFLERNGFEGPGVVITPRQA